MGEKVNRSIKYIFRCIGLASLVFLGCMIGILIEQNHQKNLEDQKESVSAIAVVNMDDGVNVDGEHVNYASKLMDFPNERFVVTGLSDAKMGIENGKYAAYIIIPEKFSVLVTSIENNPEKVILEYQYNSKLDEETRVQAINDVNAFLNLMNSNIAYVYVDAILAEFHRIQDQSAAILANDNAELQRLQDVNISQLIAITEPIDEATVNFDIQPVELNTYTNQNDALLESLLAGYLEAVQQGEDEFVAIQETNSGVGVASDNFFAAYREVIAHGAGERSMLLEIAQSNLKEAVGLYDGKVEENRQEVENMISDVMAAQLDADQEKVDLQMEEILQEMERSEDLQREWEKAFETLKERAQDNLHGQLETCQTAMEKHLEQLSREAYVQGFTDALDALDAEIVSWSGAGNPGEIAVDELQSIIAKYRTKDNSPNVDNYDQYVHAVKALLNAVSIPWDNLGITPPSYRAAMGTDARVVQDHFEIVLMPCETVDIEDKAEELMELFELQAETDNVNDVIQIYFVDALLGEDQDQMDHLSDAMNVLDQEMDEYQSVLLEYDPLKYLESAGLNFYLKDIDNNTRDMMDAIGQNNEEYMAYSAEVYQATAENMAQLRNSLSWSNEQTSTNVENCINELVLSREELNSQNVSMLETFTNSLRYTRVESKGNTEVYDYIVNPLVSQRTGQFVTKTSRQTSVQRNYVQEILIILLGTGIVVCVIEILLGYLRQYRKRQKEAEEVY